MDPPVAGSPPSGDRPSPPTPLVLPTHSPTVLGALTISPSFKRHTGVIPTEETPPQLRKQYSHLSSARRANVHETPSPVPSPAHHSTHGTMQQITNSALTSPSASPAMSHSSQNQPVRHPMRRSNDSILTVGGSPGAASANSHSRRFASLLPPHCFAFEEDWFVLTQPSSSRNINSNGPSFLEARQIQVGPLSRNILSTLIRNGHITPECLVWHAELHSLTGQEGWATVERIGLIHPAHLSSLPLSADPVPSPAQYRDGMGGMNPSPFDELGPSASSASSTNTTAATSSMALHASLMEEMLDGEDAFIADLKALLHLALKPAVYMQAQYLPHHQSHSGEEEKTFDETRQSKPSSNSSTLFHTLLRILQPVLSKLLSAHQTFRSAVSGYTKGIWRVVSGRSTLTEGLTGGNGSENEQYSRGLLYSPFLAFLPLEIPRGQANVSLRQLSPRSLHLQQQLQLQLHSGTGSASFWTGEAHSTNSPSGRNASRSLITPGSAATPAAGGSSSASGGAASTASYEYYEYVFSLLKLLEIHHILPATSVGGANTGVGVDEATLAEEEYQSPIDHAEIRAALAATLSPSSSSITSPSATNSTSHTQPLLSSLLSSMSSQFHSSLRLRRHHLRTGSSGSGSSSARTSSRASSAQPSPASLYGQDGPVFEQMWQSDRSGSGADLFANHPRTGSIGNDMSAGRDNTDESPPPMQSAYSPAGIGTLASAIASSNSSAGVGGVSAAQRRANKRASLSSLGQISEGKEVGFAAGGGANAAIHQSSGATNHAAASRTHSSPIASVSPSSQDDPSLHLLTPAQHAALLRPIVHLAFHGLVLKELLALHASGGAQGPGHRDESVSSPRGSFSSLSGSVPATSQSLMAPSELESLWHSFHGLSFLLGQQWNEHARLAGQAQLLALERVAFPTLLDQVVVRGRINSPAAPLRRYVRSGLAAVLFQVNSPGLPPSLVASGGIPIGTSPSVKAAGVGGTHLVWLTFHLLSDLLLCGRRLGQAGPPVLDGDAYDSIAADPCTYQQAWIIDSSLLVRPIGSTPTNINGTDEPLWQMELVSPGRSNSAGTNGSGRRRITMFFPSERERSSWVTALNDLVQSAGKPTIDDPSSPHQSQSHQTNLASSTASLPASLHALFNPSASSAHHNDSEDRCSHCHRFLLPGFRQRRWCTPCSRVVCEGCSVGPAKESVGLPSPSSGGGNSVGSGSSAHPFLSRPRSLSEELLLRSSASSLVVDSCLSCHPTHQPWPDLSASAFAIGGQAYVEQASVNHRAHPQPGGSPPALGSVDALELPAQGHVSRSSSSSSVLSNKPDGVRRISSSRDSNGREIVTTLAGTGVFQPTAAAAMVPGQHATQVTASSRRLSSTTALVIPSSGTASALSTSPMRLEGFRPSPNSLGQGAGSFRSNSLGFHPTGMAWTGSPASSPRALRTSSGSGIGVGSVGATGNGGSNRGSGRVTPLGSTPSGLSVQLAQSNTIGMDSPLRMRGSACGSPELESSSLSEQHQLPMTPLTPLKSPSSASISGRSDSPRTPATSQVSNGVPASSSASAGSNMQVGHHSHHSSNSSVSSRGSGGSSDPVPYAFPKIYLDADWTVRVVRAREVEATGGKSRYTTYDITLTGTFPHERDGSDGASMALIPFSSGPIDLDSTKRYSEFISFDSTLRRSRKGRSLKLPTLPPTVVFERFSPHVVEERRAAFETYLRFLLQPGQEDESLRTHAFNFLCNQPPGHTPHASITTTHE